jgi:chemotaxis protein methyltransferase CheR
METLEHSSTDYEHFCGKVAEHIGIDLLCYKRTQMERRIRTMASRVGLESLRDYWQLLTRDPAAMQKFLDRVTINVSEFFRNPERFDELRERVLPALLQERDSLLVWSAGCSYGAEAYSLSILLHELHSTHHRILATDVDANNLEKARQGVFLEHDLKNVLVDWLEKYFIHTSAGFRVRPRIMDGVEFARHDLLSHPYPGEVDLILCRNVLIYFTDEAKKRLFSGFSHALRPGGYLLIGDAERIADPAVYGLVAKSRYLYRKANSD